MVLPLEAIGNSEDRITDKTQRENPTMSVGIFTERKHQPTDAEIRQAIGPKLSLWQTLLRFIRDQYPVQEDFKFLYGKNYGWARRFRIKGQLLTSLYPTNGGFTAQVNLSSEAVEKAQGMKLGKNVQQAIERAHAYPEGRWLFIPVESEKDLRDIQRLLALRAERKLSRKELSA
jgi:hypothetical protein